MDWRQSVYHQYMSKNKQHSWLNRNEWKQNKLCTLKYECKQVSKRINEKIQYCCSIIILLLFKLYISQERIRKFFKDLVQESARYNMYINAQKSEIMVVSRQNNISVQVDHEGESLQQVHDFKFLGSLQSADGDCTKEIKRRIAMARQKAVVLASIWKEI